MSTNVAAAVTVLAGVVVTANKLKTSRQRKSRENANLAKLTRIHAARIVNARIAAGDYVGKSDDTIQNDFESLVMSLAV